MKIDRESPSRKVSYSLSSLLSISQQRHQDRLLKMETVLRLVIHDRARSIQHLVGDLFATVRRQTVHDEHIRLGPMDERRIDLEPVEVPPALRPLGLLAHAGPDIG